MRYQLSLMPVLSTRLEPVTHKEIMCWCGGQGHHTETESQERPGYEPQTAEARRWSRHSVAFLRDLFAPPKSMGRSH